MRQQQRIVGVVGHAEFDTNKIVESGMHTRPAA
jgi:hypothetical protein